ncbi:tetratricopeptide repeat-containing sensor histidine kinase [Mucilaginibacter psychrotolerans]|uniref:histidine kinase n=1 Tax=Mucilaginibacter psychrotolerans TaxID=1524096 RepID=A0A4Y8SCE2_9SPHI|nr:ATP-binding protein [Mucilaginibacter psychrotolerans]TFF36648.1 GHKL domain-containing protein [Mucilaginibacter psychrotolerans]
MHRIHSSGSKLSRSHWWLCLLLPIISACGQKKTTDTGNYSEEYLTIQKQADKIWGLNNSAAAVHYMDSAFRKLPNATINDKFRFYAFHYVHYQKLVHDYKTSLLYADSMIALAKKSVTPKQYSTNYPEANFALGDAYFELKQFNDAYQAYYEGYITGKSYLNTAAQADYTYRMGMIMYQKAQYKLAANYFKDSYRQSSVDSYTLNKDFVSFYRRQELLDNIGLSYRHNNENDTAIVYFDKALKYIGENALNFPDKKLHIDMARGVAYGNKAEVYIQNNQDQQAIALLKKSIAINLQPGFDNRDAQFSEVKLGNLYLKANQTDSLALLLHDLRSQLDTTKNPDAEADYNRLIGNYYQKKNDLSQAISHIQRYNFLKDSIAKTASLLMESDINQQLANYEKQHEIDLLSNDNKLQVIYIYAVTLVAVLTAIIMFLVFRNWRRSKKDVLTVNILNQQINEQNHVLENTLTELNNSSKEKDRILRTVAHDLRNPIGGIASLTGMMAEDDYTEEQKELINLVRETSVNSLELINEILEATNMQSVKLNLEPVEINSLVNNSVELLRFKAAEKGQKVLLETPDKQQELMVSREKIWRVISNLISNAIKFSPTGETIAVKVANCDDSVVISVKDNGIGIPEKLRNEVFNMFTSAQRPGTDGEKSFGLGLSICRQIVEKHHGKIWFESSDGRGTTFFVSLPVQPSDIASSSPQKVSVPVA